MKKKSVRALLLTMCVLLLGMVMISCSDTKFSVTLPTCSGGRITASETTVSKGGSVKLSILADEGYVIDWLKICGEAVTLAEGQTEVNLTKVEKNIDVTAQFKSVTFAIVKSETQNGTFTVAANAKLGDEVEITFAPSIGYKLSSVSIGKISGGNVPYDIATNKFIMPACDISITVVFAKIQVKAPALTYDKASATVSWTQVTNATGYKVSVDDGNTWATLTERELSYTVTTVGIVKVQVYALGNNADFFDSDIASINADNRQPITTPTLTVTDNNTSKFIISWTRPAGTTSYKYKYVLNNEDENIWKTLGQDVTSLEYMYVAKPISVKVVLYAVGDDNYQDSLKAEASFAITAPTFTQEYADEIVEYNASETVAYTLKLFTSTDTMSPITLEKHDINTSSNNAGGIDTTYNANNFVNGVYKDTLVNGNTVTLAKESSYKISYTISNHFGLEKKHDQWIVVKNNNKIDLLSEQYYPTLYSGAEYVGVMHFTTVANPGLALLGNGEVLRLKNNGDTVYANGTFINTVALGTATKLSFYAYNNSNEDTFIGFSGCGYVAIKAHSYIYWDMGEVDTAASGNYKTKDGKLGRVTPYYEGRPIIEIDVRKQPATEVVYPYDIYIGGFQVEAGSFDLTAPQLTVENKVVSWAQTPNATGYEVSIDNGTTWLSQTTTTYTPADTGKVVNVKVRATGAKPFATSVASDIDVDFRLSLLAPASVSANKKTNDYSLSWNAVEGATSYKYRAVDSKGKPICEYIDNGNNTTVASINSAVYGKTAGKVTIQVVACANGLADSAPGVFDINFVAPSFTTVPDDQMLLLKAGSATFNFGGAGQYRTDLATANLPVTYKVNLKYAIGVGDKAPGDLHPSITIPDNAPTTTAHNQYYLEITYIINDVFGIEGRHTQIILCSSSDAPANDMESVAGKYADIYSKAGVLTGDLTHIATSDYDKAIGSTVAGSLKLAKTGARAEGIITNNVFIGAQADNTVSKISFNLYNNSDSDVTFTIREVEPDTNFMIRAKSYGNYNFYVANPGAVYPHKILAVDGTLMPLTIVATTTGASIDVRIGEFMFDKGYSALKAPNLLLNGKVVSWDAVAKADSYMVSIDGGANWIDNGANLTYTVVGDAEVIVMVKAKANTFYTESAVSSVKVNEAIPLAFVTFPKNMLVKAPYAKDGSLTTKFYIDPTETAGKNYTVSPTGNSGDVISYIVRIYEATRYNAGKLYTTALDVFLNGEHAQAEADKTTGITAYNGFQYIIEWKLTNAQGKFITRKQQISVCDENKDVTSVHTDLYNDPSVVNGTVSIVDTMDAEVLGAGKILRIYSGTAVASTGGAFNKPNTYIGANARMFTVMLYNNSDCAVKFYMCGAQLADYLIIAPKSYAYCNVFKLVSPTEGGAAVVDATTGMLNNINFSVGTAVAGTTGILDVYVGHFSVGANDTMIPA